MTTNASNDIGSTTQTTLGTVTIGTWQATVVGLAYGGTGADLTAAAYQFFQTNGSNVTTLSQNYANIKTITQTAHGFSAGNVLTYNGTAYALAKADTTTDAEVVGIVIASIDANDFLMQFGGYVTGLSGLTAGSAHFLSPSSAGTLTTTAPTTTGQVIKPVLVADTTTSGYWTNQLGIQV